MGKKNYYGVYRKATDEIVAFGNAEQCTQKLRLKMHGSSMRLFLKRAQAFERNMKSLLTMIADEDDIAVGDHVIVPVGKDNHYSVAEVVKVEYFAEENVSLPLERTQHIIRKCTDEDFDPPVLNEEVD